MDDEYELTLEQLGAAETAVDKLAELLREVYGDDLGDGGYYAERIEDLFAELDLDL